MELDWPVMRWGSSSGVNFRDLERVEEHVVRLTERVDLLADELGKQRTETALLLARYVARTKLWVTIVGAIVSAIVAIGTSRWLQRVEPHKPAKSLVHEVVPMLPSPGP